MSLERERRLLIYETIFDEMGICSCLRTVMLVGMQQTIMPAVNSTLLYVNFSRRKRRGLKQHTLQ